MKILHVCAGWQDTNGAAVIARQIVRAQEADGNETAVATWASPFQIMAADEVWTHCAWLPCLWWAGLFARRFVRMPEASYDPIRLGYHGWKKRLVGILERFFLRKAAKVIATCAAERDWILAYEPKAKVEVMDITGFDWGMTLGENNQEKEKEGGSTARKGGESLRVLYMGRRHPLKGVQYLEEAVGELNAEGKDVVSLRVVSDAHGAEKEAVFAWCDVLCLPTLSENFGIVVAEALARGIPVVTTDGAPAWADEPRTDADGAMRLIYLDGFIAADRAGRVRLLKDALQRCLRPRRASCTAEPEML